MAITYGGSSRGAINARRSTDLRRAGPRARYRPSGAPSTVASIAAPAPMTTLFWSKDHWRASIRKLRAAAEVSPAGAHNAIATLYVTGNTQVMAKTTAAPVTTIVPGRLPLQTVCGAATVELQAEDRGEPLRYVLDPSRRLGIIERHRVEAVD